jgi:hypothetical protein
MAVRVLPAAFACLSLLLPATAQAQAGAPKPSSAPVPMPTISPSAPMAQASRRAGQHGLPALAPAPLRRLVEVPPTPVVQGLRHRGPGVALMVVGGAGIVTGLLIDEGVVTVAGALAGLYGLYLYLR